MKALIHGIPKAELHIHIEGALEPELMMELAVKNHIPLPFASVEEIRRAYDFRDLQSFLDLYYLGARVLVDEDDYYRLTWQYLQKAAEQNVRHTEIFFDPQTHTARGVKFETVVSGIHRALADAGQKLELSSRLFMCFLRDWPVADAMALLEEARDFKALITGVGLDSAELGYPPENFGPVFDRAHQWGFKAVAHAGEEGPPEYIWQALKRLQVDRIDHGVRCLEDAALVAYLVDKQIPLTVCPVSNVKIKVFDQMKQHNLLDMLASGLCVTVNSDDPAYFGGYIEENFLALHQAHRLTAEEVVKLARNAFKASFLDPAREKKYLNELDAFASCFIGRLSVDGKGR
jgi:adenosine deaminase